MYVLFIYKKLIKFSTYKKIKFFIKSYTEFKNIIKKIQKYKQNYLK